MFLVLLYLGVGCTFIALVGLLVSWWLAPPLP